jgi:hypothetical protein
MFSGPTNLNVYLHAYLDGRDAEQRLASYFSFHNAGRVHEALEYHTPDEAYFGTYAMAAAA